VHGTLRTTRLNSGDRPSEGLWRSRAHPHTKTRLPATTRQVATKTTLAPKTRPTRGGLGGEQKTNATTTTWFAEDHQKIIKPQYKQYPHTNTSSVLSCVRARGGVGYTSLWLGCLPGCGRVAGSQGRSSATRGTSTITRNAGIRVAVPWFAAPMKKRGTYGSVPRW